MALTDPITLVNEQAVDTDFVRVSTYKDASDWVSEITPGSDVIKLSIRHANAGASIVKGAKPARRHLLQLRREKWNSTLGKTEIMTVNLTMTHDPASSLTSQDLRNILWMACYKFGTAAGSNAFADSLIRDET